MSDVVPSSIPTVRYIPNFITREEEDYLLRKVPTVFVFSMSRVTIFPDE